MQMVNNIRRYKGTPPLQLLSQKKTIKKRNDWDDVFPRYTDYTGDVLKRNHPSALSSPSYSYVNETGRNDFMTLKVARDNQFIYFLAKTKEPIITSAGENWMTLYINSDRSFLTGWNGYDYRVIDGKYCELYKEGKWIKYIDVKFYVDINQMMISVPLKALSLDPDRLNLEFKWCDNWVNEDPMDWYVNGDTAPGGRFNYIATSLSE
ncbi:hypothetical protein [Massilibacteroides sp.]|uniref:hypothetical protein n=1 Tax=Massilibacteroides sp. TaxID=2034766 RepID=UPI002632A9CC|nr:hypothetical protein [Massilibacteroides sp.]MDD4516852.1 hypothetical protein [Massilibacteroides sp.]